MSECGPVYNVPLIDTLPLDGGMFQQMPSRNDLLDCSKRFMRVAAGYEVLLAHYTRAKARAESLESVVRVFTDYYPSGINHDLDETFALARQLIESSDWR